MPSARSPATSKSSPSTADRPFRAFHRFIESPNRSKYLFLRNSERKTVTHFSWNCSRQTARKEKAAAS
ncbi:hypothetical protein EN827_30045 [Mesorhizobium sp. M1D.F.Ca.ET.184.01.1.1]|nr:hypothetical protein EN874_030485 [Mesorhizobium sp. M1D.F.Ca.ET.231.01.1.1]TGP28040.1 hypothetical protein EN877_24140 [Mesorhizobium sp. M1D.F.Ca.ET.234.01.1.1]TGS38157.1 hypothetical protein EN827_30045 [Mesorhizobium sp. M1D.F.Ca.ET.184.01.1.1]TGS58254.1 hypothetical protein EN826_030020 [Mesorhizobium sp. M1D.F.Ca.ET.183.01.1.1]